MTLTQTAIITKQVITLSIIAIVVGLVGFIGYKIWYSYYLSTLPPVEEKADTKFGILPPPLFPPSSVSSSNFSYSVDTTTGNLPKIGEDGFEKNIKVYFLIKPFATFLSPDKSQTLASKFGITSPPQVLSEINYAFEEQQKKLTVDLDTGNFTYTREATPSGTEKLDDEKRLVFDFTNILDNLGVLKPELKDGRSKVLPQSTTAEISLWPAPIDGKPIFTADFNKSIINAKIIGSSAVLDNYLSLNFTNWQIDKDTVATYPTKPPEDALNDLRSGKGIIVIEPSNPQVSITSVYLGYYLSKEYGQYLQPIYVFEGPQFVSYVSAVSSEFIEQTK